MIQRYDSRQRWPGDCWPVSCRNLPVAMGEGQRGEEPGAGNVCRHFRFDRLSNLDWSMVRTTCSVLAVECKLEGREVEDLGVQRGRCKCCCCSRSEDSKIRTAHQQ